MTIQLELFRIPANCNSLPLPPRPGCYIDPEWLEF